MNQEERRKIALERIPLGWGVLSLMLAISTVGFLLYELFTWSYKGWAVLFFVAFVVASYRYGCLIEKELRHEQEKRNKI